MAVTDDPLVGLGYTQPAAERSFVRLSDDAPAESRAIVAEEVPIALIYNGRAHVVVMGTPADLEDLAVGFSRTEGIVGDAAHVERIDVIRASHGVELQIQIPAADAAQLQDRARGLVSRTGCGLCGVENIDDALRVPVRVGGSLRVTQDAIWRASAELSRLQTLNNETKSVHAAGWSTADGVLDIVREDVGRHNALDKVLGALARGHGAPSEGFLIVTSRASYEMVQKTATCGVELLAAISRPTGLAIRFAEAAGVTLVALVRGRSGNVYCGIERITTTTSSLSSS
jgi:formate dehydrogenase accessory protein FdhD